MNTETNTRPVRKIAITIGFVALLVLIAWLSITIVKNVPGSFASLASLAESVRSFDASQVENTSDDEAQQTTGRQNMLVVTSDTNVSNSGDNVRLSWTDASKPGSFVFSYACIDGVNIEIVESNGTRSVSCDTNYNLGDINNMVIAIDSEKNRFVDVSYTLSFLETNDTTPSASNDGVITIVNEVVPIVFNPGIDTTESTETEVDEVVENTETPAVPVSPPTSSDDTEEFTQEFTYTIPVSDPNGRVDLSIRFLGIGKIVNNTFVAQTINTNESGAVQFEVKNYGTKTSSDWTYEISLPAGGEIVSDNQAPLKPNERAVITIGFPASTVTEHTFTGVVDTTGDNTAINDQFVETVVLNK